MSQPATPPAPLSIGAVLYPGFEMLDLFGPLEMFSILGSEMTQIYCVAGAPGPVPSAMGSGPFEGPEIMARFGYDDAPPLDWLLLPGGFGTLPALDDAALLDFLTARSATAERVASVCTGSALLAKAGLLNGRRATSNKQFFALATAQSTEVEWVERARWVVDGKFWTSSGVSAGTDMSIAMIADRFGADAATQVCNATEYEHSSNPSDDPFADQLNQLAAAFATD